MSTIRAAALRPATFRRPSLAAAIWAAARRELKIFVRYPSWFIAMLIWPSLFPLGYIFTSRALAGPNGEGLARYVSFTGTTDYISYILTGTVIWMWLNTMLWNFGLSLRTEQQRGTLEANWLAPVPKWFLLAGSVLVDALQWTFFLIVGGAEFYLLYGLRIHGSPLLLGLVMLASLPSIYGLGFIFASLVLWAKDVQKAVDAVRGTMMIFCGITYPIAVLPLWMQSVSHWLPLTHSINATRAVVVGQGWSAVGGDVTFLLVSGLLLLVSGLMLFRSVERKIKSQGSMGEY
ncbi:MAG: ABC transporter permease [Bacillota bacterium]